MFNIASPDDSVGSGHVDDEVSIVMPAFNAAQTIEASIRSVLAQTHTRWVLHVVDDGSTDETVRVVQAAANGDSRVKIISLGRLGGAGAARNHAIARAASPYLAFLDADDLWMPEKLERQLARLRSGEATAVCSAYHVSADAGRTLSSIRTPPRRIFRRDMLASNKVGCLTMLIDLRRAGRVHMPEGVTHEDYVAWISLLARPQSFIEGLQEPLAVYCVHPGSRSGNKAQAAAAQWHVYRILLGMGWITAAFWMIQYALTTGTRTLLERMAISRDH